MNKPRLFLENFLIYGVGGILSKVIPVIMIPIVTRLMPDTSSFGISDMCSTVVSFGSAFAIMGMYDAMYRMFFEKEEEEYQKDICSTALLFTLGTSILVFIIMLLLKDFIAEKFFGNMRYGYLVYITAIATLVGATNSIVSAPTRMQNKRRVYLFMNTITPVLSYSISIPMLLRGYYVEALPVAGMIASISGEVVFGVMNHRWFNPFRFRMEYLKELLKIAVPLLPNFLIYWVFNSSDKLMITNILGTGATGVYSVGAKLGQASQLIYTAFAGGWQFFAFSTMRENDQVKTNSRIFEYLGIISFGCAMLIFSICECLYRVLFTGDFVQGYIASPYLFLAPLLQMLFQIACNQFLVIKKTWPNLFILSFGAVINILLNFMLIPKIGIEGAAVATLLGYVASDIVCVVVLVKMKLMIIRDKFVIAVLLLVCFFGLWRFLLKRVMLFCLLCAFFFIGLYIFLYREDILKLKSNLKESKK